MYAYPRIDDFLVWSLSWPLIHLILPYPTQHISVWATGKLGKTCHVSCWNSGVFSLFRVSLAHQCTYLLREETWWVSQTHCQLMMAMLRKFLLEYSCFTVLLGQLHFQRPAICLFRLFIPKGALCYQRQNLPSHWWYLQYRSVLCAPSPDLESRGQGTWVGSPLHLAVGLAERLDSTHREMPDHNTGSGHSVATVTRWDHEEVWPANSWREHFPSLSKPSSSELALKSTFLFPVQEGDWTEVAIRGPQGSYDELCLDSQIWNLQTCFSKKSWDFYSWFQRYDGWRVGRWLASCPMWWSTFDLRPVTSA